MRMGTRFFWCALVVLISKDVFPQPATDTLTISYPEAEAVFIRHNLRLLAGRLDIDEAKARVLQAKLWPNPTLSVGEVNLWSNGTPEELGRITSGWGNHAQIAVEVEQLIQTAAKRKKLMAVEEAGVLVAEKQFEDLVRNLKTEFRLRLSELERTQQRTVIYQQAHSQLRLLLQAYRKQFEQGNVSKSEYVRLRALEASLVSDIVDIGKQNQAAQQALKVLMGVAPHTELILVGGVPEEVPLAAFKTLTPATLLEWAQANSTALQTAQLEQIKAEHQLSYEKAHRVPDLTLQINYDRGGNIMRDFIGVGVSMDIPFFQRNQGNIRAAQATVDRSQLLAENTRNEVDGAVVQVWKALLLSIEQKEKLGADLGAELNTLQQAYQQRFAQRDISLLEYLDYLDAYLDAKDHILDNQVDIYTQIETLRYYIGDQLPLMTKTDD
ncbi:MAG TPA: TolC family protein [Parapedobacter sp.]|nr:TolC family protein [Parapedobacter sp.]